MTRPAPQLDYRTLDSAERELVREAEQRAQALGCWTTIALFFGVPMFCGLVVATWMGREDPRSFLCMLPWLIGLLAAAVAFVREVRKDFRPRAYLGGLALGIAAVAAMVAIALIATFAFVLILSSQG